MPRGVSALSMLGILVFPVAMYAAPVAFARLLLPDVVPVDGLALTAQFSGSWQRGLTLVFLVAMALQHGVALLLGARPLWLRRVEGGLNLGLGALLVAHASPMTASDGGQFNVFRLAEANAIASPIFLVIGGMMVLFGLYYAYREWTCIRPAPAPIKGAAS